MPVADYKAMPFYLALKARDPESYRWALRTAEDCRFKLNLDSATHAKLERCLIIVKLGFLRATS